MGHHQLSWLELNMLGLLPGQRDHTLLLFMMYTTQNLQPHMSLTRSDLYPCYLQHPLSTYADKSPFRKVTHNAILWKLPEHTCTVPPLLTPLGLKKCTHLGSDGMRAMEHLRKPQFVWLGRQVRPTQKPCSLQRTHWSVPRHRPTDIQLSHVPLLPCASHVTVRLYSASLSKLCAGSQHDFYYQRKGFSFKGKCQSSFCILFSFFFFFLYWAWTQGLHTELHPQHLGGWGRRITSLRAVWAM